MADPDQDTDRGEDAPGGGPSAEMIALLASLNAQRRHVLGCLDGLSEQDLHRAVLPSGWNCLGALRHLALEVEQFWFRGVLAGEPVDTEAMDVAWKVGPDVPAEQVLRLYRAECEHSDLILAAADAGSPAAWWPTEFLGDGPRKTVREIVLHAVTDTAGHAGQLDAVRELLDGKQWAVLTD